MHGLERPGQVTVDRPERDLELIRDLLGRVLVKDPQDEDPSPLRCEPCDRDAQPETYATSVNRPSTSDRQMLTSATSE